MHVSGFALHSRCTTPCETAISSCEAAAATTAATDRSEEKPQLIAFPPTPSLSRSLPAQSCLFSSSFDWRSIRHMINTGPRIMISIPFT